jgi:hypothetical protein
MEHSLKPGSGLGSTSSRVTPVRDALGGVTTVYAMQPRPSFHYPDSRRMPLLVVEVHLALDI